VDVSGGKTDPDAQDPGELTELTVAELTAPGSATLAGLLGERYRTVAKLGSGAFGDVYRARDGVLGRDVAIKRIRLEAFVEPAQLEEVKQRFLREAQVAARLRHPNIVTTHDLVSSPASSFIVMELVDGRTLQSLLAERRRLPLDETARLLGQVAAALDHAHASGVVHRDVKPANVMVEPSGHVKVMDFGIAKAEAGANLTATGLIMGTPNYMSPEQARGGKVDARSDLFSLGCVLYECLTGVRPFDADTVTAILVRIVTEEPQPVDFEATGLPPAVGDVLRRAVAKDPAARFASGAEMIASLRAAGGLPTLP
jgi:serine/threonine protein kinase